MAETPRHSGKLIADSVCAEIGERLEISVSARDYHLTSPGEARLVAVTLTVAATVIATRRR